MQDFPVSLNDPPWVKRFLHETPALVNRVYGQDGQDRDQDGHEDDIISIQLNKPVAQQIAMGHKDGTWITRIHGDPSANLNPARSQHSNDNLFGRHRQTETRLSYKYPHHQNGMTGHRARDITLIFPNIEHKLGRGVSLNDASWAG